MEHIQKALEKAKKQRQQNPLEKVSQNQNVVSRRVDTEDITYSQTHTVHVSAETLKQKRVIAGLEGDNKADIFKILRTKILQSMRANKWNVLAVCSPTAGAGKSLVATNLAVSIAMDAKHSVLLVDLDLRNPDIHDYFDLPANIGVRDFLEGKKTIPELLVHPSLDSLVVLPAGRPLQHSSDLLSTQKMQDLANEFKTRYPDRIVVVDLPPLLQIDDALVFMPNVDACVLVVAEGENSPDDVQNSINLIEEEKFLGCVLNKSTDNNLPTYYLRAKVNDSYEE